MENKTVGGPAPAAAAKSDVKPTPAKSAGLIPDLDAILATSTARQSGGSKIRPTVGYTLIPEGVKKLTSKNIPNQEQVLLRLVNGAVSPDKPVVSEPELHALVVEAKRNGTLKTKQEPWQIFRYYRTTLVKVGALRQVEVQAAAAA